MSEHDAFDRVLAAVHAATLDETCASRIPNSLAASRIEATLHGA